MATAAPPPTAPPPGEIQTELEAIAFADDKPFERYCGQDHDDDLDGTTMNSDILVEGDELTESLHVTEKMEKEMIHNCFELLTVICNVQTVKLGPHGMDQMYLATPKVVALQEELLNRPFTPNTNPVWQHLTHYVANGVVESGRDSFACRRAWQKLRSSVPWTRSSSPCSPRN